MKRDGDDNQAQISWWGSSFTEDVEYFFRMYVVLFIFVCMSSGAIAQLEYFCCFLNVQYCVCKCVIQPCWAAADPWFI